LSFLLVLLAHSGAGTQSGVRRLTTIDALHQFPGYYHLQNVLVRGEFVVEGTRTMLRADANEIHAQLDSGVSAPQGMADVRGFIVDVGRLEPGDPRVGSFGDGRDPANWPKPGEDLLLRISAATSAPVTASASVRSIALEPWKYEGQVVTIVGNFRGRNLFGDLPGAPGKSKYDFVLRGTEGALWVTDLRPKGQGFDFDINRRVDTDRWVEVSGTVEREKGLVSLKGTRVTLAKRPERVADEEPAPAPVPLLPVEVVFNAPIDGETDVRGNAPIRIQFSRGLNEQSLDGHVRLTYVGLPNAPAIAFMMSYDAAARAVVITTTQPLEAFRTVRVQLLEGLTAFDGAPPKPWTMMFSVGG